MTEFIARCYGNKKFEVIIKTDSKEHYKAAEDFARKLIDHAKPQTNGDRIRAMSDEELADLINNFDFCSLRTNEECRISYCSVCSQCVLDWLRDPVPVEGGPTDV